MRYRPLATTGMAVSAISLSLADTVARRPEDWVALVYAALENGMNAFEVAGSHPALFDGFGQAIKAVERNLVFVAWRLGWVVSNSGALARDFSVESLTTTIAGALARTGLGYLDAAVLDDPSTDELGPPALEAMKRLRDSGHVRMLGVAGANETTDAYISTGAFDLLVTSFSLKSGWKERLRLKAALEHDMAVIGAGYQPDLSVERERLTPAHRPSLWGRGRGHDSHPLAGVGSYGFLDDTPKWSSEELCLGYALTEPSLCSVQIVADRVDRIELLAKVADRELPPNVPAQIEMARFSPAAMPELERRA
ncbi:MAG TPA: aldo/keto reductase [Caulobacteraceae bacterium]|nr:aldo/keto reductase [Caulobacteraceae bacterium]